MARLDVARQRRSFASLENALELPNLIDIQRRSFEWLTGPEKGGLRETIDDISPITDYTGNLAIVFGELWFDDPPASIAECREKDMIYSRPLNMKVAFQNRDTGEIREQTVFMGDFPWMTEWGTFIINITGSTVMGLIAGYLAFKGEASQPWRLFLMTGILGGYTTFSAYSLDAALLYERGELGLAALYVIGSVVLSIAGLFAGLALVRQFA